ncbi:MAG: hypothetical protein ABR879_09125 [Methanomassiliicoccales archaeon]|jgi:hypothetical protein
MAERQLFGRPLSTHVIVLAIVGIILVIAGIAIATIHSDLRGSGLGTALLVLGFIVLIIGLWRFMAKK